MSRYQTYKNYSEYKQIMDDRSMDAICASSGNGDFQLQVQQKFLRDYVRKNSSWSKLLLYHQLGSGKTCTGITMAEEFLRSNPDGKITVVLPARLRTNFFDELISPCGMEAYISKADFLTYHDSSTSDSMKKRIQKKFMEAINARYDIMSFEKFKSLTKQFPSLKEWATYLTKDRMVIIDEVHNLINNTYKPEALHEAFEKDIVEKSVKGINTILFRYLAKNAHPSCKMVLMTATPIFDNIGQMKELALALNPDYTKTLTKLSDVIEALRGKVSFFPGTSVNAYPASRFEVHSIPLSRTQDILTQDVIIKNSDSENPDKEAFLSQQRQISLACLPREKSISKNIPKVIRNLPEYAPKIVELMKQLEHPGKHVIFSNFVKSGIHVIQAALEKAGYVSIHDAAKEGAGSHDYKVYAIWDGTVKDTDKQLIKSVANSKANIDGRLVKVILGSPSIKEGVSFKHVQHLHMMDPVWNQSSKSQVEGRAIRFCSHTDIDPKLHAPLKREVTIHLYKIVTRQGGAVVETCDMRIYDKVIPEKYQEVAFAEDALKRVAIDYYLFRKMYRSSPMSSPSSPVNQNKQSPVKILKDFPLRKKSIKQMKTNSCPKSRRPDAATGQCPANHEKRINPKGDACCYKIRVPKRKNGNDSEGATSSCPKGRAPDVNGECKTGFYPKTNKKGVVCCFKKREKTAETKKEDKKNTKKVSIKLKEKTTPE